MATPTIALRFRDVVTGTDTIDSHRNMIKSQGATLWGWWKKGFEPDHSQRLKTIFENSDTVNIFIVDRSTERMFVAVSDAWMQPIDGESVYLVPEYYRKNIDSVFGWFKFKSITNIPYDINVANKFGDGTITLDTENKLSETDANILSLEKSSILYISDIHFGDDYAYLSPGDIPKIGDKRKTLSDVVYDDLCRIGLQDDIGALVVTGDFTTHGNWNDRTRGLALKEFEQIRDKLNMPIRLVQGDATYSIMRTSLPQ